MIIQPVHSLLLDEILSVVADHSNERTLAVAMLVCSKWKKIFGQEPLWEKFDLLPCDQKVVLADLWNSKSNGIWINIDNLATEEQKPRCGRFITPPPICSKKRKIAGPIPQDQLNKRVRKLDFDYMDLN